MIDWQLIVSLLIVVAAAIQLTRLLLNKKTGCAGCNRECGSHAKTGSDLVELGDLRVKKTD